MLERTEIWKLLNWLREAEAEISLLRFHLLVLPPSLPPSLPLIEIPEEDDARLTSGDFHGDPVADTSFSNAGSACSIPGQGVRIPHTSWPENKNIKKKKQQQYRNKFSKDFKNGSHFKNLKKKSDF